MKADVFAGQSLGSRMSNKCRACFLDRTGSGRLAGMTALEASGELDKKVAAELGVCQRRGIELLDREQGNQSRREVENLEALAESYVREHDLQLQGRIARIKRLLRDALKAFRNLGKENETDADLISDLFFGDYEDKVSALGSEPFESAMKKRKIEPGNREQFKSVCAAAYSAFAPFLITFAAQSASAPSPESGLSGSSGGRTSRWHVSSTAIYVGFAGIVVAVGLGFGGFYIGHAKKSPATTGPVASGVTTPLGSAMQSTPSATHQSVPFTGKTYTEQEGHLGSITVTDPSGFSGVGQKVRPLQKVQVSCKVLAPSIDSASPDGYWYRIVTAPWNNQAYGIANTFLNGDPVIGTSNGPQHNTDFNVPDCPTP